LWKQCGMKHLPTVNWCMYHCCSALPFRHLVTIRCLYLVRGPCVASASGAADPFHHLATILLQALLTPSITLLPYCVRRF
jgi:hypothetical protein